MSDIIDLLIDDHHLIQDLLNTVISDPRKAEVEQSFDRLYACLKAHTFYEETSVYPLLVRKTESKDIALHGFEHHRQANRLLELIRVSELMDPTRTAKLTVLQEDLIIHVKMEESSLLPLLGTTVSQETMVSLGDAYRGIREKLQVKMSQTAVPEPGHCATAP